MIRTAASTRRTAWCCLAIHAVIASGLPIPLGSSAPPDGRVDPAATARLAAKDRSAAFPCRDKPCGCATAEQCFTACCCNTPAETLAWARANDVAPAVLAALERRVATAAAPVAGDTGGCCGTTAACGDTTPADRDVETATTCCCADETPAAEAAAESSRDDDAGPSEPAPAGRIVLRAMMACGGITAGWWACGASLPPPAATAITAPRPSAIVTLADESPISLPPAPDAPPPRAA